MRTSQQPEKIGCRRPITMGVIADLV